MVLAVVVGLGWAVAFPRYRKPDVFSPTVLVALLAGLGTVYPYQALRPEKGSYGYGVLSRFPIRETGFWNRPASAWRTTSPSPA